MSTGIVYIFTNPCLDWIKIGSTRKDNIQNRLNQLNSSTAIPLRFRVYATLEVTNPEIVEKGIHDLLDSIHPELRAIDESPNGKKRVREFFRISPEKAYIVFKVIAEVMGISNKLILHTLTEEQQREEEIATQRYRSRTTFRELQIKPNTELLFLKDESIRCTTHDDDNKVLYNGEITTLSNITKNILKESTNGYKLFLYNGETLWDRRLRLESSNIEEKY